MSKVALTTVDNPFNPFEEFELWFRFDESKGYHSSSLLGRVVVYSHDLPPIDRVKAIEDAIDTIIELHPNGIYRKIIDNSTED